MGTLCKGEKDGMGLRWLWREKYQAGGEGLEWLGKGGFFGWFGC